MPGLDPKATNKKKKADKETSKKVDKTESQKSKKTVSTQKKAQSQKKSAVGFKRAKQQKPDKNKKVKRQETTAQEAKNTIALLHGIVLSGVNDEKDNVDYLKVLASSIEDLCTPFVITKPNRYDDELNTFVETFNKSNEALNSIELEPSEEDENMPQSLEVRLL